MKKNARRHTERGRMENRAAQRSGRRDRAGAPQGAEPSERSERPATEGNEQNPMRGFPSAGRGPNVALGRAVERGERAAWTW